MTELAYFLAENAEQPENLKIVVSERFKDEKGEPLEWEFRVLTAEEDDALRRKYMLRVPVPGKKGRFTQDFDGNGYLAGMAAACCVYPDLNNAELQNSYHVLGPENLIKKMLYKAEFDRLIEALAPEDQETLDELVDEAKN